MRALLAALAVAAAPALRAQDTLPPVPPHETFTLDSRVLGERRTINVWVPPEYARRPRRAYPVLYMPDGGVQEDFPHVAATVDSLVRLGRIRPLVLVGIENTERRRDLTGPTRVKEDSAIAPRVGGSADFRRFLRDELIPEVARRWRVTDRRAIVGESLAGLFVVETLLEQPALFERYVALDPSLWWNGAALVTSARERLAAAGGRERRLWLATAGDSEIATETRRLVAALREAAPRGLDWRYEPRPDLTHATIFRAVKPAAFAATLWR